MFQVKSFFFYKCGDGLDIFVRQGGAPSGEILMDLNMTGEQVQGLLKELDVAQPELASVMAELPPVDDAKLEELTQLLAEANEENADLLAKVENLTPRIAPKKAAKKTAKKGKK
jgi:hypothetical protein